jgi:hypothetical protein
MSEHLVSSGTFSLMNFRSRSYTFEPLPDITPYELALATKAMMPFLASNGHRSGPAIGILDNLPPAVKRHFHHHEAQ